MNEINNENPPIKSKERWIKLKRSLKKGVKKIIPVAVGWAAGAIFPPAGGALYKFLKDKMAESSVPINISDESLQTICNDSIGEKSVDALQEKLKKALAEAPGISEEQLKVVLGTVLRPLNESLNDALDYIKTNPDQVTYLMEEWKAENQELINQLHLDMDAGFDAIQTTLSSQTAEIMGGIEQVLRKLNRFESNLDRDFALGAKSIFSMNNISATDLRVISQGQIAMSDYSSRFDIAFDPDLFVIRNEADNAFRDFLDDLSNPFSTGKYCLLVLAGAGMGKTWTLASWTHRLSEGEVIAQDVEKIVPFFISLKLGLDRQLSGYFGAPNKTVALNNLRKAKDTSELIPLLFIDGLDEVKPDEAKSVLSFITDLMKEKIPVVLACRDTDWSKEDKIIEMHSMMSDYCFEHSAGDSYGIMGVSCRPTLHLETFTDTEFSSASERYNIPIEAINNDQLRDMAKYPVLLRLFSDYYRDHGNLPDPNNPSEFQIVFIGERNAPIESNILGRFGIIGQKRDYLVQLSSRFFQKGADELTASDISDLINQTENFKTVRSAGLLKEEWGTVRTVYTLNNLFKPQLRNMVVLAGISIQPTPSAQTEPKVEPFLKEPTEEKVPFRSKMVGKTEAETLKELQKEIGNIIDDFEVDQDGNVTYLNLSSIELMKVPTTIKSFRKLMSINFSASSFDNDDELRDMALDGLDIKIEGNTYVIGQIEERKRKIEEERLRKIREEEERKRKEEEERRRKEEEERRRKEEEERKRKEAAEKKRKEEEERKRKEAAEKKRKEEAYRRAHPEEELRSQIAALEDEITMAEEDAIRKEAYAEKEIEAEFDSKIAEMQVKIDEAINSEDVALTKTLSKEQKALYNTKAKALKNKLKEINLEKQYKIKELTTQIKALQKEINLLMKNSW